MSEIYKAKEGTKFDFYASGIIIENPESGDAAYVPTGDLKEFCREVLFKDFIFEDTMDGPDGEIVTMKSIMMLSENLKKMKEMEAKIKSLKDDNENMHNERKMLEDRIMIMNEINNNHARKRLERLSKLEKEPKKKIEKLIMKDSEWVFVEMMFEKQCEIIDRMNGEE